MSSRDGVAPRWYFRGATITDEVATFTWPAPQSGWYLMMNHYGSIQVVRVPISFWRGVWDRIMHRGFWGNSEKS